MGTIRLIICIFIILLMIIILFPFQFISTIFKIKSRFFLPKIFLKVVNKVIGIKIITNYKKVKNNLNTGTLYVSNHVSWIDILCLGSLLDAKFIAKKEVSKMGLFGILAVLNNTFFIDNTNQRKSLEYNNKIQKTLMKKQNLILFPEGTTSSGNGIKKFKSSLFESTKIACLNNYNDYANVQPISMSYKLKNNLPMGIFYRRYVAWVGDYPLLNLMILFLKTGSVTVNIKFHECLNLSQFKDRKALSTFCEQQIHHALKSELMV